MKKIREGGFDIGDAAAAAEALEGIPTDGRPLAMVFVTNIEAPRPIVWHILTDGAHFRNWASAFCEGSHFVGDWQAGSEMRFLNGKGEGMISTVKINDPGERLHIKHIGTIAADGKENRDITFDWGDARENYDLLQEEGGITRLRVEMDVADNVRDFFMNAWPRALINLMELAEAEIKEAPSATLQ
ncbi:MAG: SRPBCC domain-containing protein [Gammaproteobacteria bacterium]